MTKEEKNQYIDANIEMLSNMITALKRIKNGEAEVTVLQELNIHQPTFRSYMYRKTLGYSGPDYTNNVDDDFKYMSLPTLSGAERLWMSIFKCNYSKMPPRIEKPIEAALMTLTHQEIKILRMRYWECMTYDNIAKILNLTKTRIHQIENKAIRKLRHPSRSSYLFYGELYHIKILTKRIENENEKQMAIIDQYNDAVKLNNVLKTKSNKPIIGEIKKETNIINNTAMSIRSKNILYRHGITTLEQLTNYTEEEFQRFRSVTSRTCDEVKYVMKLHDIQFKQG